MSGDADKEAALRKLVANDFNTPLTDDEIDFLDWFLLERIDEEIDTLGMDEGVLCASELDGLLTAIVSGPNAVMPSRWLPAVWGDFPPEFDTAEEAEQVISVELRRKLTRDLR